MTLYPPFTALYPPFTIPHLSSIYDSNPGAHMTRILVHGSIQGLRGKVGNLSFRQLPNGIARRVRSIIITAQARGTTSPS